MSLPPETIIEKTLAHLNARNLRIGGQVIGTITPDKLRNLGSYCYIQPLAVYRDICLHLLKEHGGETGQDAIASFAPHPEKIDEAARAARKIKSDPAYQTVYRQLCADLGVEPSLLPTRQEKDVPNPKLEGDVFTIDIAPNGSGAPVAKPAHTKAAQITQATTTPVTIKQFNTFPLPLVNNVTRPADGLTSDFIREVAVCVHNQTYMGSRKKISVEELEGRSLNKGRITLVRPLAMLFEQKLLGLTLEELGKDYSDRGVVTIQNSLITAAGRLRGKTAGDSFEMAYAMADFLELTDGQRVSLYLPPRNVLMMVEKTVTAPRDSSTHLRP